jgi:hypothetical protein
VCGAAREQARISSIDVRQAAPPLIGLPPSARTFANTVLNPIDRQDVPSRTDRRVGAREPGAGRITESDVEPERQATGSPNTRVWPEYSLDVKMICRSTVIGAAAHPDA